MINLRRADLSDTKKFAFIKAEAYGDDRSKSLPDNDNVPEWYNGKWFVGLGIMDVAEAKRLIENYHCYMILLEETPIGIFWFLQETEDSLELQDFCILPTYQGKGYGTIVLKLIEELYPNNKIWTLEHHISAHEIGIYMKKLVMNMMELLQMIQLFFIKSAFK